MMESQKIALAEQYKKLEDEIRRESSKRFVSRAVLERCEDRMARIEDKFRQCDSDITEYLRD